MSKKNISAEAVLNQTISILNDMKKYVEGRFDEISSKIDLLHARISTKMKEENDRKVRKKTSTNPPVEKKDGKDLRRTNIKTFFTDGYNSDPTYFDNKLNGKDKEGRKIPFSEWKEDILKANEGNPAQILYSHLDTKMKTQLRNVMKENTQPEEKKTQQKSEKKKNRKGKKSPKNSHVESKEEEEEGNQSEDYEELLDD
jgi:hypothetical protein